MALSYNTTVCINKNEILAQVLSCCQGKGVQINYNPLPWVSSKVQLLILLYYNTMHVGRECELQKRLLHTVHSVHET